MTKDNTNRLEQAHLEENRVEPIACMRRRTKRERLGLNIPHSDMFIFSHDHQQRRQYSNRKTDRSDFKNINSDSDNTQEGGEKRKKLLSLSR